MWVPPIAFVFATVRGDCSRSNTVKNGTLRQYLDIPSGYILRLKRLSRLVFY